MDESTTAYTYDILVYSLAFVLSTIFAYAGLVALRRPGNHWVLLATSIICSSIGTGCIGVVVWSGGGTIGSEPGYVWLAVLISLGASLVGAKAVFLLVVSKFTGIEIERLRELEREAGLPSSPVPDDTVADTNGSDGDGVVEGVTDGENP